MKEIKKKRIRRRGGEENMSTEDTFSRNVEEARKERKEGRRL